MHEALHITAAAIAAPIAKTHRAHEAGRCLMSGGAITENRSDGNRTNDSIRKKGRVLMPQMNKGGKFIFGESAIRPDGRVQFPPQAVDELPYCFGGEGVSVYSYIDLRQRPQLKDIAAEWFSEKWNIPVTAYLACMDDYLTGKTEYGWFLCLDGNQIVGGLGVIENDFHDRKDLTPNVCAVYTEKEYRCKGIAGRLLGMAVEDLRAKGISPVYLLTDHVGFYERNGWEFLCMVQGDGESEMSRMYVHK